MKHLDSLSASVIYAGTWSTTSEWNIVAIRYNKFVRISVKIKERALHEQARAAQEKNYARHKFHTFFSPIRHTRDAPCNSQSCLYHSASSFIYLKACSSSHKFFPPLSSARWCYISCSRIFEFPFFASPVDITSCGCLEEEKVLQ